MMSCRFTAIGAFMLLLFSSASLRAQDMIKSVTANDIVEVLRGAGYRAEIASNTERPYVRTGIGGHNVVVQLFDCKATACSAIQFWTGIQKSDKFTVSFVEGWNAQRRLAKFHLTQDGALHIEYDIDLSGGVSPSYIKQTALLYERLLARMDEYIRTAPSVAVDIVERAREADFLAGAGKYLESLDVLDNATVALWLKAPLTYRRALWVEAPAESFGTFTPRRDNIFATGEKMFFYGEPVGYGWRKMGEMWQMEFVADAALRNKNGEVLWEQREIMDKQLQSRVRNREFMTTFTYRFPQIPAGEYIIDAILHDRVTGKNVTTSLPFVVR
jgi:putative sensory transduction regulator